MKFISSNLTKTTLSAAILLALLSGCNESTSSSNGEDYDIGNGLVDTEFNEQALVANITDNIITPVFRAFGNAVEAQHTLIGDYCSAETAGNVGDTLTNAQTSWQNTISVWQQAEMMQVGPLLSNDKKLKEDIYSWPVVYTCGVDQDTMLFRQGGYDITSRRANRKGLYALEYLLFTTSTNHTCQVIPPEGWDLLTDQEIKVARCEFATEVARDLTSNAQLLIDGWADFSADLKSAGQEGNSFANVHDAVNHLSDAMFYLDSIAKDAKLAAPLGLFANSCGSQACPEDVESNFAYHSVENLIENLNGFNQFFTGGDSEESVGFVDYLNFVGDTDTANVMTTAIATAIADLEAYQTTLAEALENNEAQVETTHANVKAITDELKTDFINSLALELPQTSAGDND